MPQSRPEGPTRGRPMIRLRIGFIAIAMVLSVFGVRLLQLQGLDPAKYAAMAAAEGTRKVVLPAQRGDILDRSGEPLADSVDGMMLVANPQVTAPNAAELATLLSRRLGIDYFKTLAALRDDKSGNQFAYLARRVSATKANDVMGVLEKRELKGISTRRDPLRDYPNGDVASNLVGFLGVDKPLAGFEQTFNTLLAGKDGSSTYQTGAGYRIPLGKQAITRATDGQTLNTTLDRDLQWFTQRVLGKAVDDANAESGTAIVLDTQTGDVLALADYPTYDSNDPGAAKAVDRASRSMSDPYEPGSVAKVLTVSSLLDAGKVTPRTPIKVPPSLQRQDRPIGDWWDHGNIRLTMTGVLAKSSNIGTVLAADKLSPEELTGYLKKFGIGSRTDVGISHESAGILPQGAALTSQTKDRIAFGQSVSVNALQMTAAVNAIANGGVYVSPSVIQGEATLGDGTKVGTDESTSHRVVSAKAARQTARMMERVVDPEAGVAPRAQVPGYLVAGKTGTAQRVDPECKCYNGTSVSFAGFAPADNPRFTVYVVLHAPRDGSGGGSTAGPVFSRIMGYALARYKVPRTDAKPSTLPVEW